MPMPHRSDSILLAAFGSRVPGAEASLEAMRASAEAAYPEFLVETALTSGTVRAHKGAGSRQGRSPRDVLAGLLQRGVRRLAVQSLHVVPGAEYTGLAELVRTMGPESGGFERIELGRPLLGNAEDVHRAARAILKTLPGDRGQGEAVLLMAHGTRGRANGMYADLARELHALDPSVLIGALEARPGLDDKLAELDRLGARRVHLMPLLFARGKHATRDMAGADEGSWRAQLTRAGFPCCVHVQGAGERPELAALWLDHLREAVERLLA